MFKKVLIANRGEVACRLMRTLKKMGIKSVAVYPEVDTNSQHVWMADEAICIGAPTGYLNIKEIVNAVKVSGADAVHPGYGFLSENAEFARTLEKYNVNFIGPSAAAIAKMGDKIEAKKIAIKAGVNVVPGYTSVITSTKDALKLAKKVGYPVMVKAAAGGGGKGIRVVYNDDEMEQAFSATSSEAKRNFSDERVFIEKYIEKPRHIEIQVIGDKHGNYACLGERECSIQRHNQKVIEEAPSPFVDEKLRKKLYQQSISLAKKVGYFSAGTVEFIMDPKKNFYFLEMNTRLQVEHPVTELITKRDIVEEMINIANGAKLSFSQKDVKLDGWAMESRIYAEDPECGFIPSTGLITKYKEPELTENIRIDTGIYEGGEVSMFFDPMIAKLCTYGKTREEAMETMKDALGGFLISGISNNINFLQAVINHPKFQSGDISTKFIDEEYGSGFTGAELNDETSIVLLCSAAFIFLKQHQRINAIGDVDSATGTRWVVRMDGQNYPIIARVIENGFKITFENQKWSITSRWVIGTKLFQSTINGKQYNVVIEKFDEVIRLSYLGSKVNISVYSPRVAELQKYMLQNEEEENNPNVIANLCGVVTKIAVAEGDKVSAGQFLSSVIAMKMENALYATVDGTVKKVHCTVGNAVINDQLMIEIDPEKKF